MSRDIKKETRRETRYYKTRCLRSVKIEGYKNRGRGV